MTATTTDTVALTQQQIEAIAKLLLSLPAKSK